jgi:hypothetical protein
MPDVVVVGIEITEVTDGADSR